jgi:hypothetical protein
MISTMMRLVRGTPVVRMVLTAVAVLFTLWGLLPLAAYPLLRLDAASYEKAIGDAAAECPGDPIPARGGCWSAAPARVTVTGIDRQSGADIAFVVVNVRALPAVRADLADTSRGAAITVGTALTVRYWRDSVSMLVLPAPTRQAQPITLPTRDSPSYRATGLPVGDALTLLLGVAGLLVWGRPLLDDVREWREQRRAKRDDGDEGIDATPMTFGRRGLARYGLDLPAASPAPPADDVVLTGRRATPPPAEAPAPAPHQDGGSGWKIRPY